MCRNSGRNPGIQQTDSMFCFQNFTFNLCLPFSVYRLINVYSVSVKVFIETVIRRNFWRIRYPLNTFRLGKIKVSIYSSLSCWRWFLKVVNTPRNFLLCFSSTKGRKNGISVSSVTLLNKVRKGLFLSRSRLFWGTLKSILGSRGSVVITETITVTCRSFSQGIEIKKE